MDADAVQHYVSRFDALFHAPECVDITQELLAAFAGWLEFARPWDVYLKTLRALKSLEDTRLQRPGYKKPVSYQRDLVARALRQIETHRGAYIVASTGLGKTVIGTDIALRLQERGAIRNVLIVGPKATRDSWERHLRNAGLPCEYFVHQTLDTISEAHNRDVARLASILETMDDGWLVIVDESHQMRNRHQETFVRGKEQMRERLVFRRLTEAVDRTHCKVVLMTGTPYSKDVKNVNNQLFLLPQTSPFQKGLFQEYAGYTPWSIETLSELKETPVSSVLTTPYVARYYGTQDDQGTYLDFNGQHRYVPRILLYRVDFPVPLDREMSLALDQKVFRRATRYPKFSANAEVHARIAWVSSPWALREVLEKVSRSEKQGGYKGKFVCDLPTRRERCVPLLRALERMAWEDDAKLMALCAVLDRVRAEDGAKAIIFVERYATVAYLEKALNALRPSLRLASTVKPEKTSGTFRMKPAHEVMSLLENFAPVANDRPARDGAAEYDVFLTTDAMGVGVNMQDARVVIHYDLAWTPIEPAQRAGRILRFWHQARVAELHTFVPHTAERDVVSAASDLLRRWRTLTGRDDQARQILDMPSFATHRSELSEPTAFDLHTFLPAPGVLMGELDLDALANEDEAQQVSAVFRHVAILERHKTYAEALLNDLLSARQYSGSVPLLFLLLHCEGEYYWPVYDISQGRLRPALSDTDLFNLLECAEDEPLIWEDQDAVERLGDVCLEAWCKQSSAPAENVMRICTLYLKPHLQADNLSDWIQTQSESAVARTH